MIKLKYIISEIILERSYTGDVDYELFEIKDDIMHNIFSDFLYNNNDDMTKHIPWELISFPRLKKIWEDFIKIGHVRDDRGFESIENIMRDNVLKLWVLTELAGHTSSNPDEHYDDAFDSYLGNYMEYRKSKNMDPNQYQMNFDRETGKAQRPSLPKIKVTKIDNKYLDTFIEDKGLEDEMTEELKSQLKEALMDRFAYYYTTDPNSGADYLSDYGLDPLLKGLGQLRELDSPEEKLPVIDQMLNVVHQRSDLARWFVEGGSRALSQLSGMEVAA